MLSLIDVLLVPLLVVGVLGRANVLGMINLVTLFVHVLLPPLYRSTHAPSRVHARKPYLIALVAFQAFVCLLHGILQTMMALGSPIDTDTTAIIGFQPLRSPGIIVTSVVLDAALLAASIVSYRLGLAYERQGRSTLQRLYKTYISPFSALLVLLLLCGATGWSQHLFGVPFTISFILILLVYALSHQTERIAIQHSIVQPCISIGVAYIFLHLVLISLFRFHWLGSMISSDARMAFGFLDDTVFQASKIPAYLSLLSEISLMLLLCSMQSSENVDSVLYLDLNTPLRRRNSQLDVNQRPMQRVQRYIASMFLNYGRGLCSAALLLYCFLDVNVFSLGGLVVLFIGLVGYERLFSTLTPWLLFYFAIAFQTRFLFFIPHLIEQGKYAAEFGVHIPDRPYLTIFASTLPLFCLAFFSSVLSRVGSKRIGLLEAVENHYMEGVRMVLEQQPQQLISSHNEHRMNAFHVASRVGATSVLRLLLHHLDDVSGQEDLRDQAMRLLSKKDSKGRTPADIAAGHGNIAILYLLKSAGVDIPDDEITFGKSKWNNRISYEAYCFAASLFYQHGFKLTMCFLYYVGLSKVDLLHSGYLILFLLFFSLPSIVKRYWVVLVVYCIVVVVLEYAYTLFGDPNNTTETIREIGFDVVDPIIKYLSLQILLVIVSLIQLNLFRKIKRHPSLLTDLVDSDILRKPLIANLGSVIQVFFTFIGLPFIYIVMLLVSMDRAPTVLKLGYMTMLVLSLLTHTKILSPFRSLQRFWVVVVAYSASALFILYMYQFPPVYRAFASVWQHESILTPTDLGLQKLHANGSVFVQLLPYSSIFVLTVVQLRSFKLRLTPSTHPSGIALLASIKAVADAFSVVLEQYASKALVITAGTISLAFPSVIGMSFVVALVLHLPFPRGLDTLWRPMCSIAATSTLVIYIFQIPSFQKLVSNYNAAYLGIARHHGSAWYIGGYFGAFLVLCLALLQERYRLHRTTRSSFYAYLVASTQAYEPDNTAMSRLQSRAASLLADAYRYISIAFSYFYMETALIVLLCTAYVRHNIISFVYLVAYISLYIIGKRQTLVRFWPSLVALLAAALVFQFFVLLGLPPSLQWSTSQWIQNEDLREFLLMDGYNGYRLILDFLSFFFACLALHEIDSRVALNNDNSYAERLLKDEEEDRDTMWTALLQFALRWSDKIVLALVLLVASFEVDLLDFVFLAFASWALYSDPVNPRPHFKRLLVYNYCVIVLLTIYDVPFVRPSRDKFVVWERLIGLEHQENGYFFTVFIEYLVILVLLDILVKITTSDAYRKYLAKTHATPEEARKQGALRACRLEDAKRKRASMYDSKKSAVLRRLFDIFREFQLIGGSVDSWTWDREVWPTQPPKEKEDNAEEKHCVNSEPRLTPSSSFESDVKEAQDKVQSESSSASEKSEEEFVEGWTGMVQWAIAYTYNALQLWMILNSDEENRVEYVNSNSMRVWKQYRHQTTRILRNFLSSNTQSVCFFFFFLKLYIHPNMLSAFIPFVGMAGALLQNPRSSFQFWRVAVLFYMFKLCVQFLFQFPIFCFGFDGVRYAYFIDPLFICPVKADVSQSMRFLASEKDHILGVFKLPSYFAAFTLFAIPDMLCILSIFWHRAAMKERGTWDITETDILELKDEAWRCYPEAADEPDIEEDQQKPKLTHNASIHKAMALLPKPCSDALYSLVPYNTDGSENYSIKPGRDFYIYLFTIEVLSLIYTALAWSSMTEPQGPSVSQSLATNRFSGSFVVFLFLQLLILICDRAIYLYKSNWCKLGLQYAVLAYMIYFIFVYAPRHAQKSLRSNAALLFFLVLKTAYFSVSALQIRYGFPQFDMSHQFLTRNASQLRGFLFNLYRATPFLYELRTLLDWMCTDTSLDLFETLKLEDIYANLFVVKCRLIGKNRHERYTPQRCCNKFFCGTLIFIAILFLLLFPLLLFSSANPAQRSNDVQQVSLDASIGIQQAGDFSLFTISSVQSISVVSEEVFSKLAQKGVVQDIPRSSVQSLHLSPNADTNWVISTPNRDFLTSTLADPNSAPQLSLATTFTRPGPDTNRKVSTVYSMTLSAAEKQALSTALNRSELEGSIQFQGMPTTYRLPATGDPISVSFKPLPLLNLSIEEAEEEPYWRLEQAGSVEGMELITISDPYVATSFLGAAAGAAAAGIVTLYVTVVLTAGRFLRIFVSNQVQRIIHEDLNNVDVLLHLCEGIFIARALGDFHREETMYRSLIRMYRSPDLLIRLTRRKEQ